jgi:hypothetical protein
MLAMIEQGNYCQTVTLLEIKKKKKKRKQI